MYMYKSFTSDKKIKLDFIEMATICIDKDIRVIKYLLL